MQCRPYEYFHMPKQRGLFSTSPAHALQCSHTDALRLPSCQECPSRYPGRHSEHLWPCSYTSGNVWKCRRCASQYNTNTDVLTNHQAGQRMRKLFCLEILRVFDKLTTIDLLASPQSTCANPYRFYDSNMTDFASR